MMLFMIYRFGHGVQRWGILLLNVVLSAYFTGLKAPVEAMELVGYVVAHGPLAIVAGLFAAVAALCLTPLRNVQWKFLALAGALTYPVYLLHQVWGWWLIDQINPVLGKYLTLPIVMGIVFTAAYLVHRFVERPLAKPLATGTTEGLEFLGRRERSCSARCFSVADVRDSRVECGNQFRGVHEYRMAVGAGAKADPAGNNA